MLEIEQVTGMPVMHLQAQRVELFVVPALSLSPKLRLNRTPSAAPMEKWR